MTRLLCAVGIATLALSPLATVSQATTVIELAEQDLISDAAAIAIGEVTAISSFWDQSAQQIFTLITVSLEDVLKGQIAQSELTIKQAGGRVGGLESWVSGSPEFSVGERALLFLRHNPDGTLRVAHLYQGKFSLGRDALGKAVARRRPGAHVRVLRRGGGPAAQPEAEEVHDLDDLRARILSQARLRGGRPAAIGVTAPQATGPLETQAEFTYLAGTPARWVLPDLGQPVTMMMHQDGEPAAPTRGFDPIRTAYSAWSSVPGSTFRFKDGGFTTTVGFRRDGVNAISFRDPLGQIDNPVNCSGTLAIGGFSYDFVTTTVNGTVFNRIIEGDVVFNDGWQGCGFYEIFANFAESAAHELGHVIGFGHTGGNSIMNPVAHFDGRGATYGLQADDKAGLVFMYPGEGPPVPKMTINVTVVGPGTVTGPGINCGTDCSESYDRFVWATITAVPGPGATFAGWGGDCTGVQPCTLVMNGENSVTGTVIATFTGGSGGPPSGGGADIDLDVYSLSNPPATARAGTVFAIGDKVQNRGTATAPASQMTYFFSLDPARGGGDIALIGGRAVVALGPGAASKGSASVTVPDGIPGGDYYLIACVDDAQLIAEASKLNNCRASAERARVEGGGSPPPPPPAMVTLTVVKSGQGTVTGSGIDCGPDCSEAYTTGVSTTLTAVAAAEFVFSGWGAPCSGAGSCTVVMTANTTIGATFTPVSSGGGDVDLDVYSLSNPPATARAGTVFSIGDKVQNRGTVTAPASQMTYFFSLDPARGSGDIALIGGRAVVALGPGAASKGSANVTVPGGIPVGDYYLIACVDDAQLIAEVSKLNNCRASAERARVGP